VSFFEVLPRSSARRDIIVRARKHYPKKETWPPKTAPAGRKTGRAGVFERNHESDQINLAND
jgi:hypothetical protein